MRSLRFVAVYGTVLAVGFLTGCAQQNRVRVNIDPRADEALRKMGVTLSGARSFSFRSVATIDEPTRMGSLAQSTKESRVVVHRPDRLFVESRGNNDVWLLWCGGGRLTVFDKSARAYALLQVPRPIDDMLDTVAKEHGLTLPLADLLFSDPYEVLTADTHAGRYVGLHDVNGVRCHHLLFTHATLDWQIWIAATGKHLPLKLVIDHKTAAHRPQFSAVLEDWNLSARTKDDVFKAVVPKDAKQVELAELLRAEQGK